MRDDLPLSVTLEVKETCLCMRVQRAARALARRFDHALKPVGLTHGQFSVLMSLNRPYPPLLTEVSDLLGMDRTSLTAKLKALQTRGLIKTETDPGDKRVRRLALTEAGEDLLIEAVPIWRQTHQELDNSIEGVEQTDLKSDLDQLAGL